MQHYLDLLLERPLGQHILILAGLVLALAALDYGLVYRPRATGIARTTAELELARLEGARLRKVLGRLPGLRDQEETLRRDLRRLLPRLGGAATPLEDISARAALAGLEVTRFQPGTARAGEHYEEIPVELEFKGTFHDLLRFLELSAGSRLLNAADPDIQTLATGNGRTTLRIALEMVTLRLPPDGDGAVLEKDAGGETRTPDPAPAPPLERAEADLPPRDPFHPYQAATPPEPETQPGPAVAEQPPSETHPPTRFHAAGIAWGPGTPVALVNEGDGTGHVVQPGSSLGVHPYRVRGITPCEVIVEPIHDHGDRSSETRLKLPRCAIPGPMEEPAEHSAP